MSEQNFVESIKKSPPPQESSISKTCTTSFKKLYISFTISDEFEIFSTHALFSVSLRPKFLKKSCLLTLSEIILSKKFVPLDSSEI